MNNFGSSHSRASCIMLLVCGLLSFPLLAQDNVPPPPPVPPFVAQLPARLHWVVTFENVKAASPTPDPITHSIDIQPKEVDVVKFENIERQTISWNNGTKTTVFYVGGQQIFEDPRSKVLSVFGEDSGSSGALENSIPSWNFYATDWVALKEYKDTIKLGGATCYHYAETQRPAMDDGTRLPSREAWIDAETRFPIAVRSDAGAARFRYLEVPSSPIILPPTFEKAWADYQGQMKRLEAMRMR